MEEEGKGIDKSNQIGIEEDAPNGTGLQEGVGATPYILFYRRRAMAP